MAFHVHIGRMHFGWGPEAYSKSEIVPAQQYVNLTGSPQYELIDNRNAYHMYKTTAEVYSVIQRRGYLLASGVWQHKKILSNGDIVDVENSAMLKLLDNPNPLMSGNDWLREWSENLLVYGNNFGSPIYALRLFDDAPRAIYNLPVSRIEVKTTGLVYRQTDIQDIIGEYRLQVDSNGQYDVYEPKDIIHTRMGGGINPVIGDSPLIPLYMEISNLRAAKDFRNVIMKNMGALGALSGVNGANGAMPLTEDAKLDIEKQYRQSYGKEKGKAKIVMSTAEVKFTPFVYPTEQLMLFEEVTADHRVIIDHYGLNDNLFSREKASTFTNLAEGLKHAYQVTVIPDADEKAMTLSKHFGMVEKNEFLHLDYSHIPVLQINDKEKAEALNMKATAVQKLKVSQVYTDKEIREISQLTDN